MRYCCYVILLLRALLIIHLFYSKAFAFNQGFNTLTHLENNGAKVSALVVNLNSGKVIAKMSPHLRLSPASISKLVIGADALETWGPEKTFNSQIFLRGFIKNNTLYGDLIFYGGGDPYLTNEKLWFLTTDVARYGIRKITGKIIVNNSLFGPILQDENRNSGHLHSANAYDAPFSSAAVNFSVLAIVVVPAQESNEKATVTIEPYNLPSVKIINNVTTIKSGLSKIFVERNSKNGLDTFTVSGNITLNNQMKRIYRSISNPDQYAGEVINAFLNHAGVQTSGAIQIENTSLKMSDKLVSTVQSFPLAWQLRGLFEMSNNFIADMLTLNLGLQQPNSKNNNFLKSSAKNLEKFMEKVTASSSSNNVSGTAITLHSGSGLTPGNRLCAEDVVALLKKMYHKGSLFPEFLSALAVPGAEGTLKNRFTKFDSPNHLPTEFPIMLRAKTGTLTEPFDVASLAGYSKLKNGDWIAFAVIVNGSTKNTSFNIGNFRSAIDSDLSQIFMLEQK